MSRGFSFVGLFFIILIGYGIYTVAFKPGKPRAEAVVLGPPKIVMYTKSSCEPCSRAKAWLTQRQFAFEERNVEHSFEYERELKELKSQIVPVILVNGDPLYGFQSASLDEAVKDAMGQRRK